MNIIGGKTCSLFDLWSVCHFLTGVASCTIISKISSGKNGGTTAPLILILLLAYTWELLEFFLESGVAGPDIAYWFHGREFYLNRLLSDPFLMIAGYLAGCKYPRLIWPARILLAGWLWSAIVIFPHSMSYR